VHLCCKKRCACLAQYNRQGLWSCKNLRLIFLEGDLIKLSRGLGAGISASALIKHNLSTTVIEIDPAVYEAAIKYFGMPVLGPGHIFLEDARSWIQRHHAEVIRTQSERHQEDLYDIVIHDCFSGGGVPEHIFTVEFWEELKSIMHPDGLVAVVRGVFLLTRLFLNLSAGWFVRTSQVYQDPTDLAQSSSHCRRHFGNVEPSTTQRKGSQPNSSAQSFAMS